MTRLDEVRAMTRDQLMEAIECAETGRDHDRMKRKEAETQVKELEAECVKGREELHRMDEYLLGLEKQVWQLRDALDKIVHELGVPQPGYPAPVANAAEIAKDALS